MMAVCGDTWIHCTVPRHAVVMYKVEPDRLYDVTVTLTYFLAYLVCRDPPIAQSQIFQLTGLVPRKCTYVQKKVECFRLP